MATGTLRTERRSEARPPLEIRSREDAHHVVEAIQQREVGNNPRVKNWRLAKEATWLLLLVSLFLIYYLLNAVYTVMTMPSL